MKKITFIIVVLAIASFVYGYSLNGRKWFSPTVFHYNPAKGPACCLTANDQESQVRSGAPAWGNNISWGSNTTVSRAKKDGVNAVAWAKLGGMTLAVTHYISTDTSQFQVCNGNTVYKFEEVDMRFNQQTSWKNQAGCSNGWDLKGVSTHEFGHANGLGHSGVQAATMYYAVGACDFSKSSLESDDKAGYNAIYTNCN